MNPRDIYYIYSTLCRYTKYIDIFMYCCASAPMTDFHDVVGPHCKARLCSDSAFQGRSYSEFPRVHCFRPSEVGRKTSSDMWWFFHWTLMPWPADGRCSAKTKRCGRQPSCLYPLVGWSWKHGGSKSRFDYAVPSHPLTTISCSRARTQKLQYVMIMPSHVC